MLVKISSAMVCGIQALPVVIEIDVSKGLPAFQVVGKPDTVIKESKERLRIAFTNTGLSYPKGRVTINMAPAEVKKRGSHFDLAFAVGILGAIGAFDCRNLEQYGFFGELSLDGNIKGVSGILPMVMAMKKAGKTSVVVPKENVKEAALVSEMTVYGIAYLEEILPHLQGILPLKQEENSIIPLQLQHEPSTTKDYVEVRGQEAAKRAIMIAAAGGHALLMMGSPSTGKTMLAERIADIMPELSGEEILEATSVYSVAGLLRADSPYVLRRPFRRPHHKVTVAGLLGGGSIPAPGEITLANKGVLFLDEVGEFDYHLLDALRLPLEQKSITLTRQSGQYTYPADFLLVAASNPCPCGYLGDPHHQCKCTAGEILRYQKRFSGPILDRIDLHVRLTPVAYDDLHQQNVMSSAMMKQQISCARRIQQERYQGLEIQLNGQLDEQNIDDFALLDAETQALLAEAYDKLCLNPRTLLKVRKVARTIADLEQCPQITLQHLAEALQYRERMHER